MIKEKGEYRSSQESLVTIMGNVRDNLAKQIGQIGETVSNKQQLAAYIDMKSLPYTDPKWDELIQKRGLPEVMNWIVTMERRVEASRRQTNTMTEVINGNN